MTGLETDWNGKASRLLLGYRQSYDFEAAKRNQRRLVRYDRRLHETYHMAVQTVVIAQRQLWTLVSNFLLRTPSW